jgi:hypothetical protein
MNKGAIHLPSIHSFVKQNTTQKNDGNDGPYDVYKCSKCGIEGKKFEHEYCITLINEYPEDKIKFCNYPGRPDPFIGKKIKITKCWAMGANYNKCFPDSIHEIIEPPFGMGDYSMGVWVQGTMEPIKVFFDEFVLITDEIKPIRTKKPLLIRTKFPKKQLIRTRNVKPIRTKR